MLMGGGGGGGGGVMIGGLMTLFICVRGLTRESTLFVFQYDFVVFCHFFTNINFSCHMLIKAPFTLYRIASERSDFHTGFGCCLHYATVIRTVAHKCHTQTKRSQRKQKPRHESKNSRHEAKTHGTKAKTHGTKAKTHGTKEKTHGTKEKTHGTNTAQEHIFSMRGLETDLKQSNKHGGLNKNVEILSKLRGGNSYSSSSSSKLLCLLWR